jgi:hypothetical protein
VVERLREVLRPRARVEQRVASGGEVRGRLDGLTPRLVLELACRAKRDVRVSIRDSSYLYEVQVRSGAPRTAIRSANDGSFERGESVLSMLLGVSAGRFVIEPDESPCRAELSGSLHEQLAAPVARARAAQRALSAGALASVTRVAFDAARVSGYLECTPEPAQGLLRELLTGASPRDLLTSGRAPARLLEAVLSDFARRGGVVLVETAGGIEDISQTRVPPVAEPNLAALSVPDATAEPAPAPPPEPKLEPEQEPEAPPVSQRRPPAIYSQPPDKELESADAGWFSFQIEPSAPPPEVVAVEPVPPPRPLRSEDPLRKTLSSSSAPPAAEDVEAPGASVPVERGHRPELRSETLGSAGNEAAAAIAAIAREAAVEVLDPSAVVELAPTKSDSPPVKSPSAPIAKPPRPLSPVTPPVIDDDPLAQALLDAPSPPPALADAKPFGQTLPLTDAKRFGQTLPLADAKPSSDRPEAKPVVAPAAPLGQTLPLAPEPGKAAKPPGADSSETSTQPPKAVPRAAASSKAPVKAAAKAPAPAPDNEGGGLVRTLVLALLAAGVSYFGVTKIFGGTAPQPDPAAVEAPAVTPVPKPVPSVAPAAPASRLQVTTSESPLPAGLDLPPGHGLLEVQVPEATAIRVDGEYLGMGPARRVPLPPGPHALTLGDAPPQTVTVKLGQRTLAEAGSSATPAPAGSP